MPKRKSISENQENIENDSNKKPKTSGRSTRNSILKAADVNIKMDIDQAEADVKTKATKVDPEEMLYNESKLQIPVIKEILKDLKNAGSFSVSGEAIEIPKIIGLHINNQLVPFPLSDCQAKDLLINPSANGQIKEFKSDQVQIRYPYFEYKLDSLVQKVSKELGFVFGRTKALLNKMIIASSGSELIKECPTKAENKIGRLIIQLPSVYAGGEVIIHRKGAKKDVNLANINIPYTINYIGCYSDSELEIKKVNSGHLVCLFYDIIWLGQVGKCICKEDLEEKLVSTLEIFNRSIVPVGVFLKKFHHNLDSIDGIDYNVFRFLLKANEKLAANKQSNFYLVKMKLSVDYKDKFANSHGGVREAYRLIKNNCSKKERYDEVKRELKLLEFKNCKETEYLSSKKDLFQFDTLTDLINLEDNEYQLDPWEVHGNKEAYDTQDARFERFSTCFLVFWPKLNEMETRILFNFELALEKILESFKIDSLNADKFHQDFELLIKRMKQAKERGRIKFIQYEKVERVLNVLLVINDLELTKSFIGGVMIDFNEKNVSSLVSVIKKFCWNKVRESFASLMLPNTHKKFFFNELLIKVK